MNHIAPWFLFQLEGLRHLGKREAMGDDPGHVDDSRDNIIDRLVAVNLVLVEIVHSGRQDVAAATVQAVEIYLRRLADAAEENDLAGPLEKLNGLNNPLAFQVSGDDRIGAVGHQPPQALADVLPGGIDGVRRAELAGQFQFFIKQVGHDEHVRIVEPRSLGHKQAADALALDQQVRCRGDLGSGHRFEHLGQDLENRGVVDGDLGRQLDHLVKGRPDTLGDLGGRGDHVLGEAAPEAANHDRVAGLESVDVLARLLDDARGLVAQANRALGLNRPPVALVDLDVAAAQAHGLDADQDVAVADLRHRQVH